MREVSSWQGCLIRGAFSLTMDRLFLNVCNSVYDFMILTVLCSIFSGWPVSDPANVAVTWSIDGAVVSQQSVKAIDNVAKSVIEYEFKMQGLHLICEYKVELVK
jgi:hypothetical protein